ncbi:MAG: hypothetical protein CMJ78_18110 [Planctomycetaceae bacterium]|nr:hypothetical protein [Planctomycetaceae bacterium]
MSRRDQYHQSVVNALKKDGWLITDDPLTLEFAGKLIGIDLGAEKLFAAEKGNEQVALEIKSFQSASDRLVSGARCPRHNSVTLSEDGRVRAD